MRAIILAAGRGSRMQHHTDNIPKCMLTLHGKPLLHHQIDAITRAGIQDIAIVCGYQKDKIQHPQIKRRFENTRWHETSIVRSLLAADAWLQQDDCLVSYADIFYDTSAVQSLIQTNNNICITYSTKYKELWISRFTDPFADLETFKFDDKNHLTEIGARPTTWDDVQGQYMGLLKFTPTGWKNIQMILEKLPQNAVDKLDMTALLRQTIQAKQLIGVVPYHAAWGEVDHASDLELYEQIPPA